MIAIPEESRLHLAVTTQAEEASGPKPGDTFLSLLLEVRESSCIHEVKKTLLVGEPFSYVQSALFNSSSLLTSHILPDYCLSSVLLKY